MRPTHPKTKTQILDIGIPLFARAGFSGVSMRDIAKKVGISAAALYHHFSDKQILYLQAVAQAFADKAKSLSEALTAKISPEKRLFLFITRLSRLMYQDPNFRALIQRELLDGDETRLRMLAEQLFQDQFRAIADLGAELAPDRDPHLLAISMIGLVLYHFEAQTLRLYLPGGKLEHNNPEIISQHVTSLLLDGVRKKKAL